MKIDDEIKQMQEELKIWIEKNNELMFASGRGHPKLQMLKCMITYKFFGKWYNGSKEEVPELIAMAEDIADRYLDMIGKGKFLTGEEALKKFREEGY
jgi:hypothetical protein